MKPGLPENFAPALQILRDFIGMRRDSPLPQWKSREGKVSATTVTTQPAAFGLPLHQDPKIMVQPLAAKYPLEMRYAGIAGEVLVAVAVSSAGTVTDAKALHASQREFMAEAVKFTRECRFAPLKTAAGLIAFECTLAVRFELIED